MRSSFLSRLRVPLLSAAAAALVLTTTAALAGSGVGAPLNLGEINTVDARTVWEGDAGADVELRLENSGTAPALALVTPAGVPPFKVSSSSRVGGLNADQLDGFDSSRFWKLGGNPGGNFLGTTDNKALELKVNGQRALRLEPNATSPNLIGGFAGNDVAAGVLGATIAGGGQAGVANRVSGDLSAVGGGQGNIASGGASFVAGGQANTAGGLSAVAGGVDNTADSFSFVGGGDTNTASGIFSAVAGGKLNAASGDWSFVAGGQLNTASADFSTVAGGNSNAASGDFSLAAGQRAKATQEGSFVWGDARDFDISSNGVNTFTARATGGARFVSGIDANGVPNAGVTLASGSGSWSSLSDRNAKEGFTAVDEEALLRRLAGVPIERWSYKAQGSSIVHMGPSAQDFSRAFGLGEDNRHITTIDSDGVALAAIQGLYRQNKALQRETEPPRTARRAERTAYQARAGVLEALAVRPFVRRGPLGSVGAALLRRLVQNEVRHLQPTGGGIAGQVDRERAPGRNGRLDRNARVLLGRCQHHAGRAHARECDRLRGRTRSNRDDAAATELGLAVHLQRKSVRTVPAQTGSRRARAVHADPCPGLRAPHTDPLGAGAVVLSTHGGRVRPRRSGVIRPKTPTAPSEVELLAPRMPGAVPVVASWAAHKPVPAAVGVATKAPYLPPVAYRPQPTVPGASKNPP